MHTEEVFWLQVGPIFCCLCTRGALEKGSPEKRAALQKGSNGSEMEKKKWQAASTNTSSEKELTPLASSLLENFANGMSVSWQHISPHVHDHAFCCNFLCSSCQSVSAKGPSIQALAMAATQSGATGEDLQEISALGNFGKNAPHIASQMERKFCQSPDIDLPSPYLLECPVKVVTSDGIGTSLKRIGMFLPHEWFHWMSSYPHISGLDNLESFWESHSAEDPQLLGNPVKEPGVAFLFVLFICL